MKDLQVMHRRGGTGWWVIEGDWNPPYTRIISTFNQLDEAVAYVRRNSAPGRGRPNSGLNDAIVLHALKAAGTSKVTGAARILGVGRHILHRYLKRKVEQKAD